MSRAVFFLVREDESVTKYILIILVVIICILIMLISYDSNRFVIRNYVISSKKIKKEHRVVFLSDLHLKTYGKDNYKLIQAIRDVNPDRILIGGDMLTAYPGRDFTVATDFVNRISSEFPVTYAMGNHEYRAGLYPEVYGDLYEKYVNSLTGDYRKFLNNEKEELWSDTDVYGLSLEYLYYKRFKPYPMKEDYLKGILPERDDDKFSILLAHNPDYFKRYADWGADLVLSGHVHGGVVRIPGWKGVISPMWRIFPKYDGGLFEEKESTMILSRGLGMHTIPFRLFNPAEVVVIDLKPE